MDVQPKPTTSKLPETDVNMCGDFEKEYNMRFQISKLKRNQTMYKTSRNRVSVNKTVNMEKLPTGKITKNPFFNFLRELRAVCDYSGKQIAIEGGKIWQTLNKEQKDQFTKRNLRQVNRKQQTLAC